MAEWTHSICGPCWDQREPGRAPLRLKEPDTEICCFCGTATTSGIYVRQDPDTLNCIHGLDAAM